MSEIGQCEEIIQRLSHCGTIIIPEDPAEHNSLPLGFAHYTNNDGLTVLMEVGRHMNIEKEIEKIDKQLLKIEKERLKINKMLKGKFQYRKSPEEVARKHAELDEAVKNLSDQKLNLQSLRQE